MQITTCLVKQIPANNISLSSTFVLHKGQQTHLIIIWCHCVCEMKWKFQLSS